MELKVEIPEDVLFPPLPELSYVCSGRITDSKCSGPSIFRDQDFITATASDLIASMSISGLIRTRLRGRKRERWLNYMAKYGIEIEPREFTAVLKTGSLVTIYADGLDFEDVAGNTVFKEFRVTGMGNMYNVIEKLAEIEPRLMIAETRGNLWFLVSAFKIIGMDQGIRKVLEKLVNVTKTECDEITQIKSGRICLKRTS
ncbi:MULTISPECIES: hypothetical protein [Metallosphaera]|uniref:Uncharacterized protein n=3 Tax=Metallosphaera TaxID=41980 RepID=A4YGV3_METS5|nr:MULTISPECIES: hypothetical protein [Metallosphaera]ABP95655.1 hypothetical protein Msed_1498 [Metallosphaera sedula DSM 5348]AIM27639.1 hypothetical protein HA72_1498 [Metallosphaera sedula]AKV74495.1 hypothetical protein MsedA_1519 [Metallosphaera sedula]AKV76734.1 hypothetical protein MsedB_1521 [Metallosphaera sedula]AKV78985.1 hypothetical protein MsedC_1519 [Metallosphaera sedula]